MELQKGMRVVGPDKQGERKEWVVEMVEPVFTGSPSGGMSPSNKVVWLRAEEERILVSETEIKDGNGFFTVVPS